MEVRPGPGLSQGGRFWLKSRKNILALERGLKMQRSVLWRIIQMCIHTATPSFGTEAPAAEQAEACEEV